MTNFNVGDESRVWHDNNMDNVVGYVQLQNCNRNNTQLGVFRADFGPDTNVARGTLYCTTSAKLTVGDPIAGDYHFTVELINGNSSGTISADPVTIRY
ncbi:MAG TPA: hypothetical protein VFI97_05730 [Arthrobacter sp.]|nr:hypothetical protein [Arthrobacter sp.]